MSELLPRILVVDDEPWNLELMEAYLSSDYELAMATNGVEALEKVKDFEPDVILLDVLMPKMDGHQTCEILKKNDSTKFIPVILVTALSEKEDKIKGIESGADEFLSKPVDMLELKTRVHSLLKLKQQQDMVRKERDTAQKYLDVAGVMILVIDKDQNIVEINKKGKIILECSEEELIGINYFDNFVHVENREFIKKRFKKFQDEVETEECSVFEMNIMAKSGQKKVLSWNAIKLKDKNGNPAGILCSGEDITARKSAEDELKKANEHLNLLIKIAPIATIILDSEQNIVTANEKAIKLLGYDTDEIIDNSISTIICNNELFEFKDTNDLTVGFLKKNGNCIDLNIATSVIMENENKKGLVVTLQDISELRGLLIAPSIEENTKIEDTLKLESGCTYIQDSGDLNTSYEIFSTMVKQGKPGLCITRENPAKIRTKYNITKTPIVWLTKAKGSEYPSIDPAELFKLHPTIENFIKKVSDGIILIDGLEYLTLENDLRSVIKFMEQTNDSIMASDSRLILQIDPLIFDTKDHHLLKRWMRSLTEEDNYNE
ncbi:DUF835 domain-containing protein [Methanococcoides sp. SA1]|nr:DUF835 domain-containing protein [Methanococcoides sp. SA1]